MYGSVLLQGNCRLNARARVTAGFMCAPLIPPATYTPKVTAIAHPQVIRSQSPEARKMVLSFAALPDWLSAATAIATTPSPKAIRTAVPKNSDESSPHIVDRQPVRADADTAAIKSLLSRRVVLPPRRTALRDSLSSRRRASGA